MDYTEEQKLNSLFVRIAFFMGALIGFAGLGIVIYQMHMQGEDIYNIIWVPFILLPIMGFAYYMIFQTTLHTSVGKEGFSYQYAPFVRTPKLIPFSEMLSWKMRTIKNAMEFGGYGYKKRGFSRKTALIMGGNDILEIMLTGKKTIVFSTANVYMLSSAMKKYAAEKEIR